MTTRILFALVILLTATLVAREWSRPAQPDGTGAALAAPRVERVGSDVVFSTFIRPDCAFPKVWAQDLWILEHGSARLQRHPAGWCEFAVSVPRETVCALGDQ